LHRRSSAVPADDEAFRTCSSDSRVPVALPAAVHSAATARVQNIRCGRFVEAHEGPSGPGLSHAAMADAAALNMTALSQREPLTRCCVVCRAAASAAASRATTPAFSDGDSRDSTGDSLEARAGAMAQSAANCFPVWVLVGCAACGAVRCAWPCPPRRT